jgi:membrane protein
MEGSRRYTSAATGDRGKSAESPTDIPKKGWDDIVSRTRHAIARDNLSIVSGGTAFFLLLGLVPGLAALISIYGLIANPSDVQSQFAAMSRILPTDVRTVLEGQMTRIAAQHQTAGIAALISIALALWGGGAAVKTVINALNIIYHEKEKRGYVKLTATALGLALTFVVMGIVAIGLIVALPPVLAHFGLDGAARTIATLVRWPLLLIIALLGLGILYRYGPSREAPRWEWVSPGALIATLLWVLGSILFSFYAQHFSSYNKTYGSLGAIVVLMMWMYISAFAFLLGAEINAQAESQTNRDTTTGPAEPRGRRGAYVADHGAKDG